MIKGHPLIILLVEDNADHAELIRRSFRDHLVANRLIHVEDGERALDYLHRRGEFADDEAFPLPDLILLDLRLPKIDGLEVLRQIKTCPEHQAIPVVILTTSQADRDIARAYEYHANSYLVKPVEFYQFQQLMNDLGFYWLVWNTYPNPDWGEAKAAL